MRVVLDTGVLYRPKALLALAGATAVVPAVAYLERVRQLRRDGRDPAELLRLLSRLGLKVEPMTEEIAGRVPGLDDLHWNRLARDAMVACHLRPGDILWTTNPRDFLELGLAAEQVLALA